MAPEAHGRAESETGAASRTVASSLPRLLAAAAATGAAAGCRDLRREAQRLTGSSPPVFTPLPPDPAAADALHVLNRIGAGPRPGDVSQVAAMGPHAWIEEQLADKIDESPAVAWRVNTLDTVQMATEAPDALYSIDYGQLQRELSQAALLRMVYSRHQLRETLADFWTNHFNIFALKNEGSSLIPTDTERVIRPHVLGSFHEMLTASSRSPAMLAYLDNNQNRRRGDGGGPNENYARELMELHTVGVHSGYTIRDIQAVARCFTGHAVMVRWRRGEYSFDANQHDNGMKHIAFLDLTVPAGGGERDAGMVLERLAAHPATAHFVASKLARRFIGSSPEPLVARAAAAFLRSGSDIRSTLRPILLDADGLLSRGARTPLWKRPLDMVASALRAVGADTDCGEPIQRHLAAIGQPLYKWPMPDGFPDRATAWTGSLLPRWNFALALAGNAIPGTRVEIWRALEGAHLVTDGERIDALIAAFAGRHAHAADAEFLRQSLGKHAANARAAGLPESDLLAEASGLLLASPLFQTR